MSATFRCLDLDFEIEVTHSELEAFVAELFEPCAAAVVPTTRFGVRFQEGTAEPYCVYVDERLVRCTDQPPLALAQLVWEINQRVIAASGDRLLVHAACAELDGAAVLLPAASGSGKSTLVAALVADGFAYLGDDVVAIDVESHEVCPYPKPLAVGGHVRRYIPALASRPPAFGRFVGRDGFISCRELGARVGLPSPPQLVVVPQFVAGAGAQLTELGRAEALALLIEQCFAGESLGSARLQVLADVVAGCRCYRLHHSDLGSAVALVREALETRQAPPPHGEHVQRTT